MIQVHHQPSSLDPYEEILGKEPVARIRKSAAGLQGLRVIHVNATPVGGGVAEILSSLVPLMSGLGLGAEWWALDPNQDFFAVTKKIHNGLQGMPMDLSPQEIDLYIDYNRRLAREIEEITRDGAVLVLHDPQVLPSAQFVNSGSPAIWHCHIDTSTPSPQGEQLIAPLTHVPAHSIVSMAEYPMNGMPRHCLSVFPPAIDPFTPKNSPMPRDKAQRILTGMGIDTSRPLITQVSRFDPWKDPLGVIDAYRMVRQEVPGLQLALVGAITAQDDPEALEVLATVRDYAAGEPDIHLYSEARDGEPEPVNAFQTLSDVVVQKSVREGFGLTVTEAMWKGAAVVGGRCGGIAFQIQDGVNGYLASSAEECAQRILHLFEHPDDRARIGAAARQRALRSFLMPRLLMDYLHLIRELSAGRVTAGS